MGKFVLEARKKGDELQITTNSNNQTLIARKNISYESAENDGQELRNKSKTGSYCNICQKKLRSRYHLRLHLTVHTGEKNYLCGICKKGYQQKWNLITHMARVHGKEKPFRCIDCGKTFGYSSHFKRHIKSHFIEKMELPDKIKKLILNPYKCKHCDKNFDSKYRLELHIRTHTGNRPFICDKCGLSFTTRRLITNHMTKHNIKEFICEKCGNIFADQSSFSQHLIQVHEHEECLGKSGGKEKEKNCVIFSTVYKRDLVPCEVCGKSMARSSMKKHLNIHYRTRIYACRYCDKEFLESGQRIVHERKHTGEKPYLCDVCGRSHSQYGNLLVHRKRNHNLSEKPQHFKKVNVNNVQSINENPDFKSIQIKEKCSSMEAGMLSKNFTEEKSDEQSNGSLPSHLEPSKASEKVKEFEKECCDENLDQICKKACAWINKKFKESKCAKSKRIKVEIVDSEENLPISVLRSSEFVITKSVRKEKNVRSDDLKSNHGGVNLVQKLAANTKCDNYENSPIKHSQFLLKQKHYLLQELRKKMNEKIFDKIVENLKSFKDTKIKETIEKARRIQKKGKNDSLKEFLKLIKNVPENNVVRKCNGLLQWWCWICNAKLADRHLLARHLLIHEPEESRPYKCELCQKSFTQSNNYKEHMMSHNNENQFYCEKCGNGFRHKSHFNIHVRKHEDSTSNDKTKKFKCSHCEKKFRSNYHRNEHLRTHTREKPYLCKVCGSQFSASSTLYRHSITHTQAQLQCNVCFKFFKFKSSLKNHQFTHSEEVTTRIPCECGKSFSRKQTLHKHKKICKIRTEPIVKPFSCLLCSKKFLTNFDLKRHAASHDKVKKFQCNICSCQLKTKETYSRHLKIHDKTT